MNSLRAAITATAALLAITTLYLLLLPTSFHVSFAKMTTTIPLETQEPSIPMTITISPTSNPSTSEGPPPNSLPLLITIQNTSPHSLSFLRWSSPMDAHLPALGVVTFTSTATGKVAPCLNMKINHRMPANGSFKESDENIVTIGAGKKVERTVVFGGREVGLKAEEEYKVKAQGWWMGVWIHKDEGCRVGGDEKKSKLVVGEGMRMGEFESGEIVVRLPSEDSGT